MPSLALVFWQNDRMLRLTAIETHCAAAAALAPPNPHLAEESLRSLVMLLSGHFQGFCRDLYLECTQAFVAQAPAGMQTTIQAQFITELQLNTKNPTVDTIKQDFQRFASILDFTTDPANAARVTHLGQLNKWRNAVAHQKATAPAGVPPLTLPAAQSWRTSCSGLATWLDGIMYGKMLHILGVAPW